MYQLQRPVEKALEDILRVIDPSITQDQLSRIYGESSSRVTASLFSRAWHRLLFGSGKAKPVDHPEPSTLLRFIVLAAAIISATGMLMTYISRVDHSRSAHSPSIDYYPPSHPGARDDFRVRYLIEVRDSSTLEPLKNAEVTISLSLGTKVIESQRATANEFGIVRFVPSDSATRLILEYPTSHKVISVKVAVDGFKPLERSFPVDENPFIIDFLLHPAQRRAPAKKRRLT